MTEQNRQSEMLIQVLANTVSTNSTKQISPSVPPTIAPVQTRTSNGMNGNGNIQKQSQAVAVASLNTVTSPAVGGEIPNSKFQAPTETQSNNNHTISEAAQSHNQSSLDKSALENILLTVISEKTGYPTEMLELGMDMEADLGIDSIKRVEIFGSMTESYPEVSGINPNELTELRTLGQIVDYIAGQGGGESSSASTSSSSNPAPNNHTISEAAQSHNQSNLDKSALENILLTAVSYTHLTLPTICSV